MCGAITRFNIFNTLRAPPPVLLYGKYYYKYNSRNDYRKPADNQRYEQRIPAIDRPGRFNGAQFEFQLALRQAVEGSDADFFVVCPYCGKRVRLKDVQVYTAETVVAGDGNVSQETEENPDGNE